MSSGLPADNLIKTMAQQVKFVSFDMVQTAGTELTSRWYHFESIDLYFYETDDKKIVKIQVTVFGQVIDWNMFDGLRTGILLEEDMLSEGPSGVIHYDRTVSMKTVSQALLVLENAFNIELRTRNMLVKCLKTPGRGTPSHSLMYRVMRYIKKLFPQK